MTVHEVRELEIGDAIKYEDALNPDVCEVVAFVGVRVKWKSDGMEAEYQMPQLRANHFTLVK